MKCSKKQLAIGIGVFAVIGFLLALYAYGLKTGMTSGSICNINDTFSCDIVNQSSYSYLLGIPVSVLGMIAYAFMGIAAVMKLRSPEDQMITQFLLLVSTGGLLFSLYLTSIEAFVLHAWCLACVGQQIAIIFISMMSAKLYLLEKNK